MLMSGPGPDEVSEASVPGGPDPGASSGADPSAEPCEVVTEWIIDDHFLHDLPDKLRDDMELHLADCPRCVAKRLALRRATNLAAAGLVKPR